MDWASLGRCFWFGSVRFSFGSFVCHVCLFVPFVPLFLFLFGGPCSFRMFGNSRGFFFRCLFGSYLLDILWTFSPTSIYLNDVFSVLKVLCSVFDQAFPRMWYTKWFDYWSKLVWALIVRVVPWYLLGSSV